MADMIVWLGGTSLNLENQYRHEKISENLLDDQERAVTIGVPSKVNAYSDNAIGKVYEVEHPGQVCGLGVGSCPPVLLEHRHFADFVNVDSSS
ncbi:hypothetical protein CR513_47210, partial [Mucuna pruriens]